MTKNKSVSTVIATHNRPQLLVRTLECLARQKYQPREVIVVDDGSLPPTRQAVTEWQADRKPQFSLIYHRQPNSGPAVARNTGVALSSGQLIHFIDDDDLMHAGALGALASRLNPDEPAIAMASYQNRWEDGSVDDLIKPPRLNREDRLAAMIAGSWFVPIHGYLFTLAAVDLVGGWSAALSSQEDDEYLLRAAMAPVSFVSVPEALVYYCQHSGVRRATPGKPGESVLEGTEKRMFADLIIREAVFERLQEDGLVSKYRHALRRWGTRFRERYQAVPGITQLSSPLLEWLAANDAETKLPAWPLPTRHQTATHHRPVPVPLARVAGQASKKMTRPALEQHGHPHSHRVAPGVRPMGAARNTPKNWDQRKLDFKR